MSTKYFRHSMLVLLAVVISLLLFRDSSPAQAKASLGTIPPLAPVLTNPDMECDDGYYEVTGPDRKPNRIPNGWQQVLSLGHPRMNSARLQFAKSCEAEDVHIEKINGRDSFTVLAWEIETPPEPGKPFDVTIYQQTPVEPGGDYSVSGWFLTLCGGSAVPNDCPDGVYMAKMLGLDPTGGIDPDADTVVWTENRNNFVDENDERIGWSNLYTAATRRGRHDDRLRPHRQSIPMARQPRLHRRHQPDSCARRRVCRSAGRGQRRSLGPGLGRAAEPRCRGHSEAETTICSSTSMSVTRTKRRGAAWSAMRTAPAAYLSRRGVSTHPINFASAHGPNSPMTRRAPGPISAIRDRGAIHRRSCSSRKTRPSRSRSGIFDLPSIDKPWRSMLTVEM